MAKRTELTLVKLYYGIACLLFGSLGWTETSIAPQQQLTATSVQLSPCRLKGSQGFATQSADCGQLLRPENPQAPNGKQISLKVAVIRSTAPNPAADALTVINGGPGGSSITMFADLAGAFSGILRERDILIVDQRGTGQSNPLECTGLEEMSADYNAALVQEATVNCLQSLNGDPRFYTTSVAVTDLEAARQALGYAKLNLYGVSYGTRVALHYLRRYPDKVRSVVIDGVVPATTTLGPEVSTNAQLVFDSILNRCKTDKHCEAAFPTLKQDFAKVAADFKTHDRPINVRHPVTGEPQELKLSYGHIAMAVRLLSYAPESAALIPIIISETFGGNYLPVATQSLNIIAQLNGTMSYGMHNAVVCTEDVPFYDQSQLDLAALNKTYLGSEQLTVLQTMCEAWPQGVIDEDMKAAVTSDLPVLLLSGEFDPITPPSYALEAAKSLSQAKHIVAPGQGHGVIARGCIPRLVKEFVEAGSWQELDTACVDQMADTPFFINLMGPAP